MQLRAHFEAQYLRSLHYFRYFYDDVYEYGRPDEANVALYFVPGFNGVPGQVRFALPSITSLLGNKFYIRCLYLPEFSSRTPVWKKYTEANLTLRWQRLQRDILELSERFEKLIVVVSSTGFYDFLRVHSELPYGLRRRLRLVWLACAPDALSESPWEGVFSSLSGLRRGGFRWTALPNSNLLRFLNPETRVTYRWELGEQSRTLHKQDLESRFHAFGMQWMYLSTECVNWCLQSGISGATAPIDTSTFVLAATKDGYWQGKKVTDIEEVLDRYLLRKKVFYKDASHLWVNVPENLQEVLNQALRSFAVRSRELSQLRVRVGGGERVSSA